jgi:hypothetical protein
MSGSAALVGETDHDGGRVAMTGAEAAELLPRLLEARYPDEYERVDDVVAPPGSWLLRHDGGFCFLRVTDTRAPFIWIRAGVAIEIPRSSALADRVACANKDLVVGRAYMGYGEQVALVAVDETVFASSLSLDFQPSIQDLVNRLDTALLHARELSAQILEAHGGRPFAGADWIHLVF